MQIERNFRGLLFVRLAKRLARRFNFRDTISPRGARVHETYLYVHWNAYGSRSLKNRVPGWWFRWNPWGKTAIKRKKELQIRLIEFKVLRVLRFPKDFRSLRNEHRRLHRIKGKKNTRTLKEKAAKWVTNITIRRKKFFDRDLFRDTNDTHR